MSDQIQAIYEFAAGGHIHEMTQALNDAAPIMTQAQKDDLLRYCIVQRRADEVREVLLAGADPDCIQPQTSRSILSDTICNMQMEEAVLLVVLGANVNAPDANGDTPAHFAARQDASGIIDLLHRNGATLDVENQSGKTPAQVALEQGCQNATAYFASIEAKPQAPRRRISM